MTNWEIAGKLKVSPATLSLIINNKPGVSDEKRRVVLEKLQSMGYGNLIKSANVPADNNFCFVVYKKKNSVLAAHSSYTFFMEIIQKKALQYGYNLYFVIIDEELPLEMQMKNLLSMNTKGMVLYATEMRDTDVGIFASYHEPIVVIDNEFIREPYNAVLSNFEMAGYQAISYLVRMGHRRIGYLKSASPFWCFEERKQAYEKIIHEFGLSFAEKDVWDIGIHDAEKVYADIFDKIKSAKDYPTAFVTDEDSLAIGALRAFKEVKLRVPEDISIIGFNNWPMCRNTTPPLTTIDIRIKDYASRTVEELMRMVKNKENQLNSTSFKIYIGTSLVERGSVANIAGR